MYKKTAPERTSFMVPKDKAYKGETIEQKIQRIVNNKEPIKDGAPIIFTDRKDGVNPAHDIRTDRFEVALDAMDKVTKSHTAKREHSIGERTYDTMNEDQQKEFNKKYPNNKHAKRIAEEAKNKNTGGESTQATDGK